METWDVAEEACKKQLVISDGNEKAGMERLGTSRFRRMVLAVESVLEKHTEKDEWDR